MILKRECRQGEMTDGRDVTMQPGGDFVARRLGEEIAEGRVHPDGRVTFHWGEGAISGAEVLGALGLAGDLREALQRAACEESAAVRQMSSLEATSSAECGLCCRIHLPWRDVPASTIERIIAAAGVDPEQAREQMRAMDRHWRR